MNGRISPVFGEKRSPITTLDRWGTLRDNGGAPPRPLPLLPGRSRRSAHATLLTVAVARGRSDDQRFAQPAPNAEEPHAYGCLWTVEVARIAGRLSGPGRPR